MNVRIIFGISALMGFVSATVAGVFYAWPWLRTRVRSQALASLVTPHMFLRILGLSFLVPGVVSSALPASFAVPAAYGDLVAAILAIGASIGLARRSAWSIQAVWMFNIWGTADMLFAMFEGARARLDPEALGAAFYVITMFVPLVLVSHILIFAVPVGRDRTAAGEPGRS